MSAHGHPKRIPPHVARTGNQSVPRAAGTRHRVRPHSPLNRGFLGGTVNEYTQFDKTNDNRPTLPRFTPQALRANYRIVEALNHFGRTHGMTSSQIALLWLLDKADWIVPIPGTTKISHLEENLRSLDFKVSRTEWDELEKQVAAINIVGDRYPAEQQNQINSN